MQQEQQMEQSGAHTHSSKVALTEYMAFSASRALACLMASTSSLSFLNILTNTNGKVNPAKCLLLFLDADILNSLIKIIWKNAFPYCCSVYFRGDERFQSIFSRSEAVCSNQITAFYRTDRSYIPIKHTAILLGCLGVWAGLHTVLEPVDLCW